jgi:hypothetical protein
VYAPSGEISSSTNPTFPGGSTSVVKTSIPMTPTFRDSHRSIGLRVSDSQVIKAALLLAEPDKRLLKAYLEIKGADQRYKQEPEE